MNKFYCWKWKIKICTLSVLAQCAYNREGSFGLDCCAKQTNADVAAKATSVAVCDGFYVGSFV